MALVTGSSRGLGRHIATGFAREGARVVVCARTSSPAGEGLSIEGTVQQIKQAGGEAVAIQCDVTDEDNVARLVDQTIQRWGRIDVLVNNAAVVWPQGLLDTSADVWRETMRTNIDGAYYCIMAVLSHMMRQGSGSIINISSTLAFTESAAFTPYATAKAALNRLSVKLAAEVRQHGIAVNVFCPGRTLTERLIMLKERYPELLSSTGWLTLEQRKIVPACVFLARQTGEGFTGKVVIEDDFGKSWP